MGDSAFLPPQIRYLVIFSIISSLHILQDRVNLIQQEAWWRVRGQAVPGNRVSRHQDEKSYECSNRWLRLTGSRQARPRQAGMLEMV